MFYTFLEFFSYRCPTVVLTWNNELCSNTPMHFNSHIAIFVVDITLQCWFFSPPFLKFWKWMLDVEPLCNCEIKSWTHEPYFILISQYLSEIMLWKEKNTEQLVMQVKSMAVTNIHDMWFLFYFICLLWMLPFGEKKNTHKTLVLLYIYLCLLCSLLYCARREKREFIPVAKAIELMLLNCEMCIQK